MFAILRSTPKLDYRFQFQMSVLLPLKDLCNPEQDPGIRNEETTIILTNSHFDHKTSCSTPTPPTPAGKFLYPFSLLQLWVHRLFAFQINGQEALLLRFTISILWKFSFLCSFEALMRQIFFSFLYDCGKEENFSLWFISSEENFL